MRFYPSSFLTKLSKRRASKIIANAAQNLYSSNTLPHAFHHVHHQTSFSQQAPVRNFSTALQPVTSKSTTDEKDKIAGILIFCVMPVLFCLLFYFKNQSDKEAYAQIKMYLKLLAHSPGSLSEQDMQKLSELMLQFPRLKDAMFRFIEGNYTSSLRNYNKFFEDLEPEYRAYYLCYLGAFFSIRRENDNEALAFFEQALSLNPELVNPYILKAGILANSGYYHAALQNYEQALQRTPCIDLYAKKAGLLIKLGQYAEALNICEQVLQLHPQAAERADIQAGKARALAKLGRYEEACKVYDQIIPPYPVIEDFFQYAYALIKSGQPDKAYGLYLFAIEYIPSHKEYAGRILRRMAAIHHQSGNEKEALKKYQDAEIYLQEAISAYTKPTPLVSNLGYTKTAFEDSQKLLRLYLKAAHVYQEKGLILNQLNHPKAALENYGQAVIFLDKVIREIKHYIPPEQLKLNPSMTALLHQASVLHDAILAVEAMLASESRYAKALAHYKQALLDSSQAIQTAEKNTSSEQEAVVNYITQLVQAAKLQETSSETLHEQLDSTLQTIHKETIQPLLSLTFPEQIQLMSRQLKTLSRTLLETAKAVVIHDTEDSKEQPQPAIQKAEGKSFIRQNLEFFKATVINPSSLDKQQNREETAPTFKY